MGHQQDGFALDPSVKFLPQDVFAAVVHGAGGFVEQHDGRVEQHRPGHQYGLALAAGQQLPAFAHGPVEALRVLPGQFGHAGHFRHFEHA
ncbi:hypothetical protein D3C76_596900 [compost metagenome]